MEAQEGGRAAAMGVPWGAAPAALGGVQGESGALQPFLGPRVEVCPRDALKEAAFNVRWVTAFC